MHDYNGIGTMNNLAVSEQVACAMYLTILITNIIIVINAFIVIKNSNFNYYSR